MRKSFREHMTATAFKMMRPTEINPPSGFGSGGGGACPPDMSLSSRKYISPLFQFITIPAIGPPYVAIADYSIILPTPVKCIMVVSRLLSANNNSLYLHFVPLNKNYGGAIAILPTGNDQWIPLTGITSIGPVGSIGSCLIFEQELPAGQPLFFDIGVEAGGTSSPITLLLTNSLKYFKLAPQGGG